MAIELLMLGLDEVMFDTEAAHLRSCNAAFKSSGIDLQWSTQHLRAAIQAWGANNAVAAIANKMLHLGTSDADAHLHNEKKRLFREFIEANPPTLHRGCARLIEAALERGCKVAVVTDMPSSAATTLLEQAYGDSLHSVFSVIATDANFVAPSENGPHHLVQRTVGADLRHCVVIDASPLGVAAAQRAGIWSVDIGSESVDTVAYRKNGKGGSSDAFGSFISFDFLSALRDEMPSNTPRAKGLTPICISA